MVERPAGLPPFLARARGLALPVVGGLLLMMYGALAVIYWQQQGQQGSIRGQLAQLSRVVAQPREGLEGLQAQVEEAQQLIPQDIQETEVYPAIRALAAEDGVVISSQSAGKVTQDKIGGTVYRVLPFAVQVGGEDVSYQQVVDFIANLETQQVLPTLLLDNVAISQTGGTATATIDFRIYLRPEKKPTPTPKPGPQG